MRMVLGIDPGNSHSAYALLDAMHVKAFGKVQNGALLRTLQPLAESKPICAVEMIASYGMPVGREVFDTCVFIGRVMERWYRLTNSDPSLVTRHEVKMEICKNARARDSNIRAALMDLYGGASTAVGKKATPGPLYGVSGDVWAAIAVAITHSRQIGMFR